METLNNHQLLRSFTDRMDLIWNQYDEIFHRIVEHDELEGIHKDQQLQFPALHRTIAGIPPSA